MSKEFIKTNGWHILKFIAFILSACAVMYIQLNFVPRATFDTHANDVAARIESARNKVASDVAAESAVIQQKFQTVVSIEKYSDDMNRDKEVRAMEKKLVEQQIESLKLVDAANRSLIDKSGELYVGQISRLTDEVRLLSTKMTEVTTILKTQPK